jgi:methylated-DNA-[protein]-cysteine S-methyltransferase
MSDLEQILRESAEIEVGATANARSQDVVPRFTPPDGIALISYCVEESPVGKLLLARTARGLVRVAFLRSGSDDRWTVQELGTVLQELADRISPRVVEHGAALDTVRRELDQFFSGARESFDLPLDWQLTSGFRRKVLRATASIPFGVRSTYKAVATRAGSPNAFRAAGTALGANPLPIVVPCHRVMHSDGGLGGYAGGVERKLTLLRIEGFA